MAISTINRAMTKDEGESEGIICPECKNTVRLRLFSVLDFSPVTALKKKNKNLSFAVCPSCSAVFDINENYIKEKKNGTSVIITESDIKKR